VYRVDLYLFYLVDMTKLIVTFRNLRKRLKMYDYLQYILYTSKKLVAP